MGFNEPLDQDIPASYKKLALPHLLARLWNASRHRFMPAVEFMHIPVKLTTCSAKLLLLSRGYTDYECEKHWIPPVLQSSAFYGLAS